MLDLLKSKTVWGAIAAFGIAIANYAGIDTSFISGAADYASVAVDPKLVALSGAGLAFVGTVYGRIKAKGPISISSKGVAGTLLLAALAGAAPSACTWVNGGVGKVGDKVLGTCADPAVVFQRDHQFTELLAEHYGADAVSGLRDALDLMDQTVRAGKPISDARAAYQAKFVAFAVHRGIVTGLAVAAGSYATVIKKIEDSPDFSADLAMIKARTTLACPDVGAAEK